MELINIIRTPREIPNSERKSYSIDLSGKCLTLESLQKMLDKHIERFKAQGFTIFTLSFGVHSYDNDDTATTLTEEKSIIIYKIGITQGETLLIAVRHWVQSELGDVVNVPRKILV